MLYGSARAQTATASDQEDVAQLKEQVQQLEQRGRDLEQRLLTLESRQSQRAETKENTLDPPPPEEQPAAASAGDWHDLRGIQWRGFGEVDYKVLDQRNPELGTGGFVPGSQGNFYSGDFGLFLTPRLTAKATVLSEIAFEERDAQRYRVDLRRMLLKYDYNERMQWSFGRYQTSIGYYNWAFRSAAWLQTTVDRPLVMQYASDGGLLPTQAIGLSMTGTIPSGRLGLHYVAEYGSSDTVRPDINGDGESTDENNGNQINVALFARPESIPGLQIGGSYYHDQISEIQTNSFTGASVPPPPGSLPSSARYGQTILSAYAVYTAHEIEFLNEGFLVRHSLLGGPIHFDTPAFYSQVSRKFGRFRPFLRYQYVNASPNNAIYNDISLRFGPALGARYDFNDYMAFKAQVERTARRGLPDLGSLQFQWAFTF